MTEEQARNVVQAGVTRLATGRTPEVIERSDGRWEPVYNLVDPLVATEVGAFLTQQDCGVAIWEDPLWYAGILGYASTQRSRWVGSDGRLVGLAGSPGGVAG